MPSVTWVGGTATSSDWFAASRSAAAPSGLTAGDRLYAFVASLADITPPAGWTRIDSCPTFSNPSYTERLRLYQKDTVSSGDSGVSFTWTNSTSTSISVTYAAARGVGTQEVAHATVSSTTTYTVTPASLTAAEDGELFLIVGTTIVQADVYPFPQVSFPSGFTRWTGTNESLFRLSGAYKAFDSGQSNSGVIVMDPEAPGASNGLGSITLRLNGSSAPGASAISSASSPLGEVSALSALRVFARPSADGPLGAPAGLAYAEPVALVSAPGPLGECLTTAFHDFTDQLEASGAVTYYACDLVDGAAVTRVPISSWQGTLQTAGSTYLQAVIPAAATIAATIAALSDTAEFVIYRGARLPDGAIIEQEMSRSVIETTQFDQGPQRYTCTISGYSDAIAPPVSADPATDRTLRGVRSVSSGAGGIRVRCAIDWFLQPGQTAIVDGLPFVADYLNYYAMARESYMDVGESAV